MDPRTVQHKQQKVEWGLSLNWAFHSRYTSTVARRLSGRALNGGCCLEESWDLGWQDLEVWRLYRKVLGLKAAECVGKKPSSSQ